MKKNDADNKYKKIAQRSSSVFQQKKPMYKSKSSLEKNKNKIESDNMANNKTIFRQ